MLTVYCRMCLSPSQFHEMMSLFDKYRGFSIRDALLDLFQIKILPTEMLSTICKKCIAKVCTVREIREEFIAQDRKYRQMISNSTDEESSSTEKNNESERVHADTEPSAAVESTVAEEQHQQEDFREKVGSSNPADVKEPSAAESRNINSIICYVEESNETERQDATPQSEYEVIMSQSPGKSPVRFQIANCSQEDNENSNLEPAADKNNEDEISVKEYCEYTEDTADSTDANSGEDSVHCESAYVCEWCECYFKTKDAYIVHACANQSESIQQEFESQSKKVHCKDSSNKRARLEDTKKTVVGFATNIICPHCSDVFDQDSKLLEHGKLKHPEEFETVECNQCTEEFATYDALYKHESSQHRNGYECRYCKKKLLNSNALQSHENVHTKRQTFSCSVCNKMFSQYTSMWRHMRIHNDIKAYECDICQRRFRQRTVMLAHRLIHTGEKPYVCEVCDKSFRDRSTLARHRQVHSKARTKKNK
ncbi:zinc finger and SCAN domain-containing protein 12-like [Anopheles maculipalpis]|uniref:zinc finger and SCAN domain-containing protein 12-like n=1 Tax=Anopheles maculipalpis TaxID=1496333 RepID=UPI002158BC14|nr:zinc finger and SCAN domain-containing protein 12-like [Anopheles maculipalpis]